MEMEKAFRTLVSEGFHPSDVEAAVDSLIAAGGLSAEGTLTDEEVEIVRDQLSEYDSE